MKESRAVPAGYDSNVRRRVQTSAGNKGNIRGSALRVVAGMGLLIGAKEAGVPIEKPVEESVQAVVRTVESAADQGSKLVEADSSKELRKARLMFKQALMREDGSIVHNVMIDPKSEIDVNGRRRPSTMIEGPGGLAVEDPSFKLKPGTIVGTGMVVFGNDPQNPRDRSKKSRWVYIKDSNGRDGFVHSDNVVIAGHPSGAIYKIPPKSLK